ncbi:MAG: helix-turn-helix domain-containing protein [Thermoleophilaceae bacterium]|jgi:transcriptional regulator with XRE-family HTH domain
MTPSAVLKAARREAGVTQSELAERLGKSQATVASLERSGANPTVSTLDHALRALGHRLELRAVPYEPNVDETLLARNLRMTPVERLSAFEIAHREVTDLRRLMRRRGASG